MSCPFCDRIARGDVLLTSQHAVTFRDIAPEAEGHTLVVPRACVPSLFDLDDAALADLWHLARDARDELRRQTGAAGFNLTVNEGAAAGQSVAHAHLHLIPRHPGDLPTLLARKGAKALSLLMRRR